jgi:hypothetical protein
MKRIYFLLFMFAALSTVFTSCDKDDVAMPTVSDVELGASNSHKGYVGADLHVEATILAEGKTSNIRVLIHQETEEESKSAFAVASEVWVYDSTYTGVYANVKNTTFHEHIDVPANVVTGTYHFHLYVTDLEGNQTMIEEELEIAAPVADGSLPTISVTSAPATNASFASGSTISIAGTITDTQGLAGVYIGLVKESLQLEDSKVSSSNTIAILHNHDFEDPKSYAFSASIKVGATTDNDITPKAIEWTSGNYFILVKSPGVDGEVGFSARYPVVITVN